MKNIVPSVNLLKESEKSFIDKFITWSLSTGRIVIILTETIALGAFLYRFSLDQQIIDLHDNIKKKEQLIAFSKKSESSFRNLQDRISVAKTFSQKGDTSMNMYLDILSLAQGKVIINNMITDVDQVKFNITVLSAQQLQSFVQSLQKNTNVSSVSIEKIQNKTSRAAIEADILAKLKQTKQ